MNNTDFHSRGVRDERLAVHATSALPAWLWSWDGTRILWANPVGARLLGAETATDLAARTFGPALYGSYWRGLWIYFIAPPLAMLAAGEVFLLARERRGPYCAKLHHHNDKRCIFRHS